MAANSIWQDREIRFDAPNSQLQCRTGEVVIDHISPVEDTKGNNGEKGKLYVTNLRVVWVSSAHTRINLSIGYKTVTSISTKRAHSKLRGNTEALYIMTKLEHTQFEFVFTNLVSNSPRLFAAVMAVYKAYESSRLYRELKLRSSLLANKELKLLPQEQLYSKLTGVWNLCSDQGNLGTMYITNIRVVWHSNMNETFNVSIPYLQMGVVKIRDSKFGIAMVVETVQSCGGYVLGFRVDPVEKLKDIVQEIHSLYQVYLTSPNFGVDYKIEEEAPETVDTTAVEDDTDILESPESTKMDTFAAYLADNQKEKDRKPVFSEELGLAIERLPEGYSLSDLWQVS